MAAPIGGNVGGSRYGGLGLVTTTFVPPAMTFFNVYAEIAV